MARTKKNGNSKIDPKLLEEEYLIHLDEDDDRLWWAKKALKNCLNPLERKIYITYIEQGTYAGVARAFNCTCPTAKNYIKGLTARIQEYICEHL